MFVVKTSMTANMGYGKSTIFQIMGITLICLGIIRLFISGSTPGHKIHKDKRRFATKNYLERALFLLQ